jgi:hypothetical protein
MTPADPDVLVMPDMDTLTLLPWKPGVAWVTGDLYMGGKPVAQNPRQVLKGLIAKAAEQGVELKTGVECEYFLISPDGTAISDPADQQAKPCYDQQALMRRYEIVAEICDAMISLGWKPYQNDHEDANGQFEMNWEFDDRAEDRRSPCLLQVHGQVDRREARLQGDLHAEAVCQSHWQRLPRPYLGVGPCRQVQRFCRQEHGTRSFREGPPLPRRHHEARFGTCGDLQPDRQLLQAHQCTAYPLWCDLGAKHGDLDRQQPYPHGACARPRPLRTASARRRGQPVPDAPRSDVDMYREGHTVTHGAKLPLNLLDALRAYDEDSELKAAMGEEFSAAYVKLKHQEWNSYASHFTQWERDHTLDV